MNQLINSRKLLSYLKLKEKLLNICFANICLWQLTTNKTLFLITTIDLIGVCSGITARNERCDKCIASIVCFKCNYATFTPINSIELIGVKVALQFANCKLQIATCNVCNAFIASRVSCIYAIAFTYSCQTVLKSNDSLEFGKKFNMRSMDKVYLGLGKKTCLSLNLIFQIW